jgi:acetyltransferase-like isoleucine patch superfamily enzyme
MGTPDLRDVGIRADVVFGERVVLYRPVNLYGCLFGDDVTIGPFVEVQSGVRVGRRTKIQSHAFICEGVTIGQDCFVSHGVMFINDTFDQGRPAGGDRSLWKTTTVSDGVSIGTGAVILPVRICASAVVGAGAVVTRDIEVPGVYAGNPARLLRRIPEPRG